MKVNYKKEAKMLVIPSSIIDCRNETIIHITVYTDYLIRVYYKTLSF